MKFGSLFRLITRGTLEEKIMSLQEFKTKLATTIISLENTDAQTMLGALPSSCNVAATKEFGRSTDSPAHTSVASQESMAKLWAESVDDW